MTLAIDFANREVHTLDCPCCGVPIERSSGFVQRDGDTYAVYFASCYHHNQDAFLDVVLGTWGRDDFTDHVTFGCRVGSVDEAVGPPEPACSLVTGGEVAADSALFGEKLTRDDALNHPWLDDFWAVVDFVLAEDPIVRAHIYG